MLNDRLDILHPDEIDNYTLQVSSPGISRVFKDKNSKRGSTIIEGKLAGFKDDVVNIDTEDGSILIPLNKITKTKLNG